MRFNKCLGTSDNKAYGLLVHEAGHVLGVTRVDNAMDNSGDYIRSHPFKVASPLTAMSYQLELRCSPHPFDIMAINALYQSW